MHAPSVKGMPMYPERIRLMSEAERDREMEAHFRERREEEVQETMLREEQLERDEARIELSSLRAG